jgi:polysaccharide pyruvyl transferase WcaK-like protein
MEDPVGNVVVIDEIEDLGFVDVSGISEGMEDAVRVHSIILAMALGNPWVRPSSDGLWAPGG